MRRRRRHRTPDLQTSKAFCLMRSAVATSPRRKKEKKHKKGNKEKKSKKKHKHRD